MFSAEELLTKDGIEDLLNRDADAPIFTRLGLNYGKAVRFKSEMSKLLPQQKIVPGKNDKPTNVKPRMEDSLFFSRTKEYLPSQVSSSGMFCSTNIMN